MIAKIKGAFNYLFNRIFILRDDIKTLKKRGKFFAKIIFNS